MTPELDFMIEHAMPLPYAATPQLAFKLRIEQVPLRSHNEEQVAAKKIHSVALACQIRIEPTERSYDEASRIRLRELFGPPEQWGRSLHSMLWTHVTVVVPEFERTTIVELPSPCSFDFNIAATKYFDALGDGEIPLCFLFSGTIFYESNNDTLQIAQIAWEKEAKFRLPIEVWRKTVELYYPNTAWLCFDKGLFDRMQAYKRDQGLPTWEGVMERLLEAAVEEVPQ